MICFINRSTVDYDVRLQKYVKACIEEGCPYLVLSWDRMHNCNNVYPHEYQFKMYSPYGNKWKNIISIVCWYLWIILMLTKHFREYKVIHACNIENLIISIPFKLLNKKIVFDIYDTVNGKIEHVFAKKSDLLILPSTLRFEQIFMERTDVKNYLEIENVPFLSNNISLKTNVEFPQTVHLAYVGVLQRDIRGLENLFELVNTDKRFTLDVAGVGEGLEDELRDMSSRNTRIKYHGKVSYERALEIMSSADFIVALYYLIAAEHKYASPNKYYESLYLMRPVITSNNTLVGNKVKECNTGYVIDDTFESLKSLFQNVDSADFKDNYIIKRNNCKELWENKYKNYFETAVKGNYLQTVKEMLEQCQK